MELPAEQLTEIHRVLAEIDGARFDPVGWNEIDTATDELERALRSGELVAVRAATTLLAQSVFEAKVRDRFTKDLRGRSKPPVVAPTKRSSALPIVGIVCGLPILAIGWLLGGGVLLAVAIAFELFVLVVAVSGSRIAHRPGVTDDGVEPPVPAPDPVADRLRRLARLVERG